MGVKSNFTDLKKWTDGKGVRTVREDIGIVNARNHGFDANLGHFVTFFFFIEPLHLHPYWSFPPYLFVVEIIQ